MVHKSPVVAQTSHLAILNQEQLQTPQAFSRRVKDALVQPLRGEGTYQSMDLVDMKMPRSLRRLRNLNHLYGETSEQPRMLLSDPQAGGLGLGRYASQPFL